MTGTGSAVFGIFPDEAQAEGALSALGSLECFRCTALPVGENSCIRIRMTVYTLLRPGTAREYIGVWAVFIMKFKSKERVRIFEAALLVALCASLCAGTWAQGQQAALSRELVRLHVVAASDEAREQAVKLEVRDAVLAYLEPRLDGVEDSAAAREVISGSLQGIAEAAAERAPEGAA